MSRITTHVLNTSSGRPAAGVRVTLDFSGRRLAECIQDEVPAVLGVKAGEPAGMALPVLRETRMPAVLCELGPPPVVVARGAELACAFSRALERWVRTLDSV